MEKLRVGVVLRQDYSPTDGGGYSYYTRLVEGIDSHNFNPIIEIIFISPADITKKGFKNKIVCYNTSESKLFSSNFKNIISFIHWLKQISSLKLKKYLNIKSSNATLEFQTLLEKEKIHLLYYLAPEYMVTPLNCNIPYIITHWDLGHKSTFAFPELTINNEFENRDNYHKSVLQKAFAIFVESLAGKTELVSYERINPDRILVVPMFSSSIVEKKFTIDEQRSVLEKYNLEKDKFYFYPAQFWAHKNHYTLLKAFSLFILKYPSFKLVLTGSDKNNMSYIKNIILQYELSDSVILAGFVNELELYSFYTNTSALIMPTTLGPTNMPLLEAQELNCKIICSDIQGHREILSDNVFYFDPYDEKDIFNKMVLSLSTKLTEVKNHNSLAFTINTIESNLLYLYKRRKLFE